MKKAYYKDSIRKTKKSIFRYISIIIIIMLGVLFFIGMNSVSPDMEYTAEQYLKDQNVYDLQIVSNMGFEKEDVEKFEKLDHVKYVEPAYNYDVLISSNGKDQAIRLISETDGEVNKPKLIKGRKIEKKNECLIDTRLANISGYEIGQTIKIFNGDGEDLNDTVDQTEFEIVGITINPAYISLFYGNTKLLTGELTGYLIVSEEIFEENPYTTLYVKMDIDENIARFSTEYEEKLDNLTENVSKLQEEISTEKYNKYYKEAADKINEYKNTLNKGEEYIDSTYANLYSSQIQVNNSIEQIGTTISALYNNANIGQEIQSQNKNLNNLYYNKIQTESEINSSKERLEKAENELNSVTSEVNSLDTKINKLMYEEKLLNEDDLKSISIDRELTELQYNFREKKNEQKQKEKVYTEIKKDIESKNSKVQGLEKDIKEAQDKYYNNFKGLETIILGTNNGQIISSYYQIKSAQEKIDEGQKKLTENDYKTKLEDAQKQIKDKENELKSLEKVNVITKLYENSGFKSLKNDLQKMKIMGRIFPVMFFIVAALVTITTITRMIEEDRSSIGTLKALGYSKTTIMKRYIIYSLSATVIGTTLGILIGSTAMVKLLFLVYSSLYALPDVIYKLNYFYCMLAIIIAMTATVLTTLIITWNELKETAASLIRPKAAKEGKNILLERIPAIWRKLDFLFKVSFRNIFRYKKRLFMTLIGIAGCSVLLYSGFALSSSINSIGKKQFNDIRKFSMEIYFEQEINAKDLAETEKYVSEQEGVKEITPVRQQSITIKKDDNIKDIFYIAIDQEKVNDYIQLKNRHTGKKIELEENGVVMTEKLANELGAEKGSKVKLVQDGEEITVKVAEITENYLYNYIFLTPDMYKQIFGQEIKYNEFFANTDDMEEAEESDLLEKIKEDKNISTIVLNRTLNEEFKKSLNSLMSIVLIFIVSAALLSFVVLVNLNNINIEERKRELATIKLLGFYKTELYSYIFRENIILTILGGILGLGIGILVLGLIIQSAEVETILLPKQVNIVNLTCAFAMTMLFTIITNMLMKKKIRKIDMIDSLKSVE